MNILVIGNGFDLAHGLPTKYTDFLKFVKAIRYIVGENKEESDVTAWNDLNSSIKDEISRQFHQDCVVLGDMYRNLIKDNVWIDYFLQNPMYQKENWIDFEREISRVIRLLDGDMKENAATESTIIEKISVQFFYDYFFVHLKRSKEKRDSEMYKLATEENIFGNELQKFTINYEKKHPVRILKDKATYSDLIMRMESDLNKLIYALEIYLADFLGKVEISKVSKDIKELNIDHVLSFNYTNTFEKLYGQERNIEYDYIHGKADINNTIVTNNMVLGIDEYLDDDRKNKDIEFIAFKKYYQRIHRQTGCKYREWTDEIKQKYKEYKKRMKNVFYEIIEAMKDGTFNKFPYQDKIDTEKLQEECPQHNLYIFGHSLDVTDKDILRDLILNDNVHTTIFYYKEHNDSGRTDLGKKIANLVKVIGQDELIKRTGGSTKTIEFVPQQSEEENNGVEVI